MKFNISLIYLILIILVHIDYKCIGTKVLSAGKGVA